MRSPVDSAPGHGAPLFTKYGFLRPFGRHHLAAFFAQFLDQPAETGAPEFRMALLQCPAIVNGFGAEPTADGLLHLGTEPEQAIHVEPCSIPNSSIITTGLQG